MQTVSRTRNYWTAEEDRILREQAMLQVNTVGSVKNWNSIAAKLESRTNKDCRKRWSKLQTNVNKGFWSPDEDDRLRRAVEQHGFSWTVVAQDVQTRHADQCAKRWYHFLDPNLIHEEWNAEEDERLLEAVRAYGRVWRVISEKEFPRRSATDIKNRYIIVQRRRANGKLTLSLSPSRSGHVDALPLAPDTASGSDMAYESDSDLELGGLSQDISPVPFKASSPANHHLFDSSYFAPFLDSEDIDIDMSLLPDLIDSFPGPFGPLDTQFTPTDPGTDSPPAPAGMMDTEDYMITGAPELVPFSPFCAPADLSWLESLPEMHASGSKDLLQFASSTNVLATQPDAEHQAETHKYNLLLEDVQPEILSHIMDIVLKSQRQVKVKLSSAGHHSNM